MPVVIDLHHHPGYCWRINLNEMLKPPLADDKFDALSIGHLKQVSRILHWIMSHVLRPKHGGYSMVDQAEIHLIYILLHGIRINWPHYFVACMFSIKECNKGTSFFYVSMIAKTLIFSTLGLQT